MALKDVIAHFGFTVDDKNLKKADASVESAVAGVQSLIQALGALAVVRFGKALVDQLTDFGDELDKTARRLGTSTDQLQAWRHAAGLSGVATGELDVGLKTLAKAASDAERGGKTQAEAFDLLGVSVTDTAGNLRPVTELLYDTGLALQGVESDTKRAALAQELLGRSGAKLNVIFDQGEEGLSAMLAELEKFGGGFGKDAVKAAADMADANLRWDLALTSIKSKLAVSILPGLTGLTEKLSRGVAWLSRMAEGTNAVNSFLTSIGIVGAKSFVGLLRQFAPVLRMVAAAIVRFAFLWLIVDDIYTLFTGGESVIGDFFKSLLGDEYDQVAEGFGKIRDAVKAAFGGDWKKAQADFDQGMVRLTQVADRGLTKILRDWTDVGSVIGEAGFLNEAADAFENFWPTVSASWDQGIWDLKQDVKNFANDHIAILVELNSKVKAKFNEWIAMGKKAVIDLKDGILDGLKNIIPDVVSGALDLGRGMIKGLRDGIIAKSPSVAGERAAIDLGLGVIKGLIASREPVVQATNHMITGHPMMRSAVANVNQNNSFSIQVQGGSTGVQTGRAIGRTVAPMLRPDYSAAYAALVPLAE